MSGQRLRILICEDDERLATLVTDTLVADGRFDVIARATNGDEAIRLAEEHQPDAAILDVGMPGGGGVRAVREIAQKSPKTSMIALSGYDDRNTVLEMLEAGATAYLVKGASREEILRTLKKSMEAHEKLAELG